MDLSKFKCKAGLVVSLRCISVADPGGGGKGAMPPLACKTRPKKDGRRTQRLIFYVSWPPSPKFLDPLLLFEIQDAQKIFVALNSPVAMKVW